VAKSTDIEALIYEVEHNDKEFPELGEASQATAIEFLLANMDSLRRWLQNERMKEGTAQHTQNYGTEPKAWQRSGRHG